MRTGDALNISNTLMPYFQLMHEMTIDHLHEDGQTPGYQFLRMILQVLTHQDGHRRRSILNSPQHREQFTPLLNVFPLARSPSPIATPSTCRSRWPR